MSVKAGFAFGSCTWAANLHDRGRATTSLNLLINSGLSLRWICLMSNRAQSQGQSSEKVETDDWAGLPGCSFYGT